MPTVLTFRIAPSGGDYTSMTACRAANARNLVTADEQHIYEFETFPGGLSDNDAFPGYTDDATRNLILRAATGHEWDGIDPTSGFYFNGSAALTIRPLSGIQNMVIDNLCQIGGNGLFAVNNGGNFQSVSSVGMDSVASPIQNGVSASLSSILIINPPSDGGIVSTNADKITVVNAGNRGLVLVGGSAVTNSFVYGSSSVDFSNQGGAHSNNASSDSTAAGSSSLINRTTADFANFAGNDFRTASGSALATAGTGGTFIGYALEAGGTPSVSSDPIANASTITQPILSQSYTLTVDGLLSAHTLSQPALSQGGSVSSDNLSNDHNVTQPSLTTMVQLSPNALSNDGVITEPLLTQKNAIASANVSHDNTISQPNLTQGNVLAVNALVSDQSISNVTLAVLGVLPVQSLTNTQNLTQPSLSASNSLSVDGLSNDNQLSISTLIQKHLLSADSLSHDQALTQPVISVSDALSVQSIISSQTLTDSGLTQHLAIITNNITNTQFIGNVILNGKDQTIGTVTAAFKDNGIGVKYGVAEFTVKFKD